MLIETPLATGLNIKVIRRQKTHMHAHIHNKPNKNTCSERWVILWVPTINGARRTQLAVVAECINFLI